MCEMRTQGESSRRRVHNGSRPWFLIPSGDRRRAVASSMAAISAAFAVAIFALLGTGCDDKLAPLPPEDVTPPATKSIQVAGTPTANSVTLTWLAPGDDGNTGTAAEYDVRYWTGSNTATNWGSAPPITGEPTPHAAGTAETFTVTGLAASTTYFFAVKTRDEVSNWSDLSNVVAVTTSSVGKNRIGIYTTPTGGAAFIDPAPALATNFNLYFVLTNPTEAGAPLAFVNGFEFNVTMTTGPSGDFLRILETLPANSIQLGDSSDPANATYACGFGAPVPVTDGEVLLLTWRARIYDATDPYLFYLSPVDNPTFPGRLAFLNSANSGVAADGSAATYADPVFAIGGVPWATENETVGAIKALFR
jgi:hypothetical protein